MPFEKRKKKKKKKRKEEEAKQRLTVVEPKKSLTVWSTCTVCYKGMLFELHIAQIVTLIVKTQYMRSGVARGCVIWEADDELKKCTR